MIWSGLFISQGSFCSRPPFEVEFGACGMRIMLRSANIYVKKTALGGQHRRAALDGLGAYVGCGEFWRRFIMVGWFLRLTAKPL